MNKAINITAAVLIVCLLNLWGCSNRSVFRNSIPPEQLTKLSELTSVPFIKLHLKSGEVVLFSEWSVNPADSSVTGKGKWFNEDRALIDSNEFSIPFSKIVLAESNTIKTKDVTTVLTTLTVVTVLIGIYCLANPKACFGSCPTFYAPGSGSDLVQAEGFSSSISPYLEESDIDALYRVKPSASKLEIKLTNEAMETHVIRYAHLLALPKPKNGRVFSTPSGEFFQADNITEALYASSDEVDCTEKLCSFDGVEMYSPADSNNLTTKEEIILIFNPATSKDKGLILASRQTLLTTYLFYQGLAYMGTSAGEWIAKLEREGETVKNILLTPVNMLGAIEIFVQDENGVWIRKGTAGEHGPISTDINIIPLNDLNSAKELKIKLRMTKGLWRIDYAALADLGDKVIPQRIMPVECSPYTQDGSDPSFLLSDTLNQLVTMPGDVYTLHYQLPENYNDYELFMESKGYYLEWMRDEWLKEENAAKVYQMYFNSKQFFKEIAPEFKKVEADMEKSFWSSKYVR